ncbi:MAG TPA: hypothetical protein VG456_10525 [Candidatus Sulfopaludibacter sp.]|nr:hypothetical protein [Candidatus Sulfopaludibacter sp.]
MKYFFTGRLPDVRSILLVESGSRGVLERVVPGLRRTWGSDVAIDLVSCYSSLPDGFDAASTRVFRVADYRGREGRRRLYRELRQRQYSLMGIVCSEEPLMFKWKWALTAQVPAKVFVINENGDYFWLDRLHLKPIRKFVLLRAGLAGSGAVRTLARLVTFPFTLLFLLLYATTVHARRALRKATS